MKDYLKQKYLRDDEGLSETEIARRTKFNLADFLKMNEGIREGLGDRVGLVDGRVKFQSLDKYRGDGAGNTDGGAGQFTVEQIDDFNVIDGAVRLFGNDRQGLVEFMKKFDDDTLAAYRRYKRGE